MGDGGGDGGMTTSEDSLILVYNADSGLFTALADAAHKLLSPATYACSLCAITYGAFAMHRAWRDFLGSLPLKKRFHHRDDFRIAWPGIDIPLPAILIQRNGQEPQLLIDAATLAVQPDLPALIATIRAALARNYETN